jgi:hypothetical protein
VAVQELRRAVSARAGERLDGGMKYLKLDRMAYYVHKDSYLRAMRKHLRALGVPATVRGAARP